MSATITSRMRIIGSRKVSKNACPKVSRAGSGSTFAPWMRRDASASAVVSPPCVNALLLPGAAPPHSGKRSSAHGAYEIHDQVCTEYKCQSLACPSAVNRRNEDHQAHQCDACGLLPRRIGAFLTAISAAAAMRLCQRVSQSTMPVTIIAAVMRISSAQKIFTARSS